MVVQKTPVSILQELMQRNQKPIPTYSSSDVANVNGDFTCSLSVDGIQTVGYGKTKKEAKHNSAKNAVDILQHKYSNNLIKTTDVIIAPKAVQFTTSPMVNYVGALNEFCSKKSISYPEYNEKGFDGQDFNITCSLNDIIALGKGTTKKVAKQEAARVVLERVKLSNKFPMAEMQKFVCDEASTKIITEMYKELTIMEKKFVPPELNISTELDFSMCNLKQLQDVGVLPLEQEDYPPTEKSEEKLRNMGIDDYSVSVFVREPLMLVFKAKEVIPATFTLIQDGATYTETKRILLATAVKFIYILKSQ
ncbi:interferon-inducible double-stranded RNA-dependent protein kinase activator A homolog A-like [Agrilus planipennis]|uniref:Interferon-inducible double-stranded RNA-dependent protein kinase activator A homolog A n=1 Tax=Agrilus planipennis TaxID=224129 RepID=A0A1W4XBN2_AGRPL|nr:interferon-inducible double-stranded RNA-dependent protein kinase activator A homolog A [Agrilus planipennis]XP_025831307.1 interferon-inducible double-stranded RNA-dependent protein kinase activator A homolog A-like [Agrilus planipennis]